MNASGAKVFVIGGGIVGLSCALAAQARGFEVTIADPSGYGEGASYGTAGVLATSECLPLASPGIVWSFPKMLLNPTGPLTIRWRYLPLLAPWLLKFARSCTRERFQAGALALSSLLKNARAAHGRLAAQADIEDRILDVGWLKLFESDQTFNPAKAEFEAMENLGVSCEHLSSGEIARREPALARSFKHGILHAGCSQIQDPGAYVRRLGDLFERRGGTLVKCEIVRLETAGDQVICAHTQSERFKANQFVVAAGAWSKKLASDAGAPVPLGTERGYHLVFDVAHEQLLSQPAFWAEQSVVMSPSKGSVRITNGVELASLAAKPDFRRFNRQIPGLAGAFVAGAVQSVREEWLGFRPSLPDSLPVIGRASERSNCILAFGHGHIGFTAGPVTGELVGNLLSAEATPIDIKPFSPGRFM